MVLKVPVEELYCSSNRAEKLFDKMGHGSLVGGRSNLEFLTEFRQLKYHRFWSIGNINSEVWNGINDFVGGVLKRLSWFNWCVNRHRGLIVSGGSIRISKSGSWV